MTYIPENDRYPWTPPPDPFLILARVLVGEDARPLNPLAGCASIRAMSLLLFRPTALEGGATLGVS